MKKIPVKEYSVSYVAIYDVTETVMAENAEQAVDLIKQGHGRLADESWNRFHPDTEYIVEEV